MSLMTYKPEIDGLRAVGVLLVLFCHMQLGMTGGYIGVDVFFVISGFLITSIILDEVEQKKFNLLNFYLRRFIRLYPALLVTVLIVFFAGFLLASPEMLANLAKTGKYTLASISNLYFYKYQGYFDLDALQQPFLHTWTLGVEWQFYLITPLLIWLLSKISRDAVLIGLAMLVGASCVASTYQIPINANQAYYLLPYRAFELGIGGLLVFFYSKKIPHKLSFVLLFLGFAAILFAGITYSASTKFPGRYALLPCLGAAACIYGGKDIIKGNFLRWKPVVYIGKASYSIYLVHWPLLIFYTYQIYRDINILEKWALVIASLVLGILSYIFVERKVTWKKLSIRKHGQVIGSTAILSVSLLIAYALHYVAEKDVGLPWRISNTYVNNTDYTTWGGEGYAKNIKLGDEKSEPFAILTGDSFAISYALGLDELLSSTGKSVLMNVELGCLVSKNYERIDIPDVGSCNALFSNLFEDGSDLPIIITQAWGSYIYRKFSDENKKYSFSSQEELIPFLEKNLDDLRLSAKKRKLIIISSTAYFGSKNKRMMMRPTYFGDIEPRRYHTNKLQYFLSNEFLKHYASKHENIHFIDITPIACSDGICTEERAAMLYHDDSHFSKYGSRIASVYIMQELEKILDK